MSLSTKEVKAIQADQLSEEERIKAEMWKMKKEIEQSASWFLFVTNHSGQEGIRNGPFWDCVANRNVIEEWLQKNAQGTITQASFETAFNACRSRLGERPETPYEQHTDLQVSRVAPQVRHVRGPAPVQLAYTRDQILSWSKDRLKQEMKSPEHVAELNRILKSN